jgi:thioredoxin reductase
MKTQSFKLFELLNLEAELAGATNNQTGEKIIEGLLNQKLPVITKYHLNILLSNLSAEKKTIDALRDELIKKYGKEDENGNIGISMVIETGEVNDKGEPVKDINPSYIEFNDEYGELLNQEKEIQATGFFVAIGHKPNTDIFKDFIHLDETGYIKYAQPGTSKTNVDGVFVAGDAADKTYRQAITAAGTGCMAALDAERYLASKD